MTIPVRFLLSSAALLAGCSVTPSTRITQPLTATPPARLASQENNGAIFQPRQGLALFEDRRARQVGDILTVRLVEKTEAKRKSETKEDRKANADISVPSPTLLGHRGVTGGTTAWAPQSTNKQEFKDDETNSNSVSGAITVTVVEVLENGNLVVAGEKQVAVNNDTEYLRLSGVASPHDINREGSIDSTRLANVKFESKNAQSLDGSQFASMMARFFLTVLPF